jgi:hypothetical protein
MPRIGNITIAFILAVLTLMLLPGSYHTVSAQDIKVEAVVSENRLFTGERVNFTIEISGGGLRNLTPPAAPDIPELHLVNPTPSTSTSFTLINGVASTKYAYSYTYIALIEGDYVFPAVSMTIGGETYTTRPIRISVIDRNRAADSQDRESLPDVFVRLEVSENRPVVGQQIIAELVLYFKDTIEVMSFQPAAGWRTDGFWKENLSDGNQPRAESVLMNGVRYRKAVLTRHALFPGRADRLVLSSYKVTANLRYSARYRDSFSGVFGSLGRNQRTLELETEPVTINVQPLPNTTTQFIGAVGQFEISRIVTSSEITIGEPLEVITRVEGIGNVPLIRQPEFSFPDAFEDYRPQESMNFNVQLGRVQGHKLFTNVLIARRAGQFRIPETTLSYYDDRSRRYMTRTLPAIDITVNRDPNIVYSYVQDSRFTLTPLTGSVAWVNTAVGSVHSNSSRWWLWFGLMLPVILTVSLYGYNTWQKHLKENPAILRSKLAYEKALQKLDEASNAGTDYRLAYAAIYRAITGFIADKKQAAVTGQPDSYYLRYLEDAGIEADSVTLCKKLLERCSTIRYAPNTTRTFLNKDIENTRNLLNQLRKVL